MRTPQVRRLVARAAPLFLLLAGEGLPFHVDCAVRVERGFPESPGRAGSLHAEQGAPQPELGDALDVALIAELRDDTVDLLAVVAAYVGSDASSGMSSTMPSMTPFMWGSRHLPAGGGDQPVSTLADLVEGPGPVTQSPSPAAKCS